MTIDPRVGVWISVIAAVLAFVAVSTAQLTTLFSAGAADKITAWAAFLSGVINAVNAVLHMIPGTTPTPADQHKYMLGPST